MNLLYTLKQILVLVASGFALANSSICGGDFVFVENFGRETRLVVCERSKFSTSAKDAPKDEFN